MMASARSCQYSASLGSSTGPVSLPPVGMLLIVLGVRVFLGVSKALDVAVERPHEVARLPYPVGGAIEVLDSL
jgi:hypothetical protein